MIQLLHESCDDSKNLEDGKAFVVIDTISLEHFFTCTQLYNWVYNAQEIEMHVLNLSTYLFACGVVDMCWHIWKQSKY